MSIRISNGQAGALVRSYALAQFDQGALTVAWLELAPQHPKVTGAIWASLVTHSKKGLELYDDEAGQRHTVFGLRHRYEMKKVPVPAAAGRARPTFMRLVAPEVRTLDAFYIERPRPFCAVEWRWTNAAGQLQVIDAATSLAAMLERGTQHPVRIAWGPYLLGEAIARNCATPLLTGGPAPQGYCIQLAPWDEIISAGVASGQIRLSDAAEIELPMTVLAPARERVPELVAA